ncbi:MAG: allophanate hydrolase subunit 1 [Actinobacteria bacterium]|nr:allophanate hydrolase subunit 1 [Actinomycetota bacterium]
MEILPCGAEALLVECDSLVDALALDAVMIPTALPGVIEMVPAARSVLIHFDPTRTSADFVAAQVRRLSTTATGVEPASRVVEIDLAYDGPDLAAVAQLLGVDREEVIARHTATEWRCGFVGFAPGFPYLVGGGDLLRVPRHAEPRVTVPAGSVALAGEYCGIYPRTSPGGWQLIGTTRAPLWDLTRTEPALITPGARVRFVPVQT